MSEQNFTLPVRVGERPETGPHVPHLQHTQKSPDHTREALKAWALKSLPNVRDENTRISVSTTRAFWLDESVAPAHDDCFMPPPGGREFAHLHLDGSLHLCMSEAAIEELVQKSWGEPHPLKDQGVNEVLLYAPRNEEDLEIAKLVLAESYVYATGRRIVL